MKRPSWSTIWQLGLYGIYLVVIFWISPEWWIFSVISIVYLSAGFFWMGMLNVVDNARFPDRRVGEADPSLMSVYEWVQLIRTHALSWFAVGFFAYEGQEPLGLFKFVVCVWLFVFWFSYWPIMRNEALEGIREFFSPTLWVKDETEQLRRIAGTGSQ